MLKECCPLYEYSAFIQKIRDYLETGGTRDEAIARGMADCVRDGIMVDFIQAHGTEVRNMLFTEFNMEDALEVRGEERFLEGKKLGKAEGKAEGKADEIRIIRRKLLKGLSTKEISELLELDEAYVAEIKKLHTKRESPYKPHSGLQGACSLLLLFFLYHFVITISINTMFYHYFICLSA